MPRLGATLRIMAFALSLQLAVPHRACAASSGSAPSDTKIFFTTSTYGVMAGTLIGVASLAFTSTPSSHLNRIAIGASLGLYVGILLGAYIAYGTGPSKSSGGHADLDDPASLRLRASRQITPLPYLSVDENGHPLGGFALNF